MNQWVFECEAWSPQPSETAKQEIQEFQVEEDSLPYRNSYALTGIASEARDVWAGEKQWRRHEHAGAELVLTVGVDRVQVQFDASAFQVTANLPMTVTGALKTAVGTGDQPPDPPYDAEAHAEATMHAIRRIRRNRRRLTQADAENIVCDEANARGVKVSTHFVGGLTRSALRSTWWPILHPKQARREGYRFMGAGREAGDQGDPTGDGRWLVAADLLHPAQVQLDVGTLCFQGTQAATVGPGEKCPQIRLGVNAGQALEAGQVGSDSHPRAAWPQWNRRRRPVGSQAQEDRRS